jgi:hypothetical protein
MMSLVREDSLAAISAVSACPAAAGPQEPRQGSGNRSTLPETDIVYHAPMPSA